METKETIEEIKEDRNNWRFTATQSELITIAVDVIGVDREDATLTEPVDGKVDLTRIVTWNDAVIEIDDEPGGSQILDGKFIRTFNVEIANDAERFYTLNGLLAPQDIAPRKRDVTGSISVMGRHASLANLAVTNEDRCTE